MIALISRKDKQNLKHPIKLNCDGCGKLSYCTTINPLTDDEETLCGKCKERHYDELEDFNFYEDDF
jgi:ribosomal protein L33